MKNVLITGFEPFDGERVNPSWEVVRQLNDLMLGGVRVVARQLPCVFGEALTALNVAIDELQPALVLAIGQAGGRADMTIERVAINIDDARIPDNKGQQPVDQPIIDAG
ncbi:pyroglutamyl-peptidase I, partial [Yersinia ruckeri]|nr:pyroglutamyl-peptidase I [Yersinia ruckeri]